MSDYIKNSKGERLYLLIMVNTNTIEPYTEVRTWEEAIASFNVLTAERNDDQFFAQLISKEINNDYFKAKAIMRKNHKGWGCDFFTYITIEPLFSRNW